LILKTAPTTVVATIEVYGNGGMASHSPGKRTITDVEIICPDDDSSKDKVWNRLKYGMEPDLGEAMHSHQKIEVLDFPEDGITLYGVWPRKMERSACWDGRLFECSIDSYVVSEVIK